MQHEFPEFFSQPLQSLTLVNHVQQVYPDDADSLTVHLTSKDFAQPNLFVSGVLDNTIYLNSDGQMISTYYTVNGTRKDVELLEVEI